MMDVEDNITEYIETITKYLSKNKVPYVIVGGLAVNAIGRTRMTMDLDLIIDHTKFNRQEFVEFLSNNGFDISLTDLDGLDEKTHCTFYPNNSSFRIDLKGSYSHLEKESIEMALDFKFDEVDVRIDNPINLILFKLKFGSEQDIEDAYAVYAHNEEDRLDKDLLERSKIIGVEHKIEQFLEKVKELIGTEKKGTK